MVMEATPTPSSVGREFVRQYYTLLNKAPTHLHRFYNHQSSFVHGGLDPPNRETAPVIGQKAIHQKIQQLGFRDCHAKITQVDSQATLGQGVVVQVTGELSNAGQPMRRFTQTFVLAAQSPKKFYVHNDIFRYQDEIINDEEYDGESRSEPEEDIVVVSSSTQDLQHHQPQQQQQQQQIVSEAVVSQQQQQMAPPPQSVAAASVAAAAAAPPPQPQMQYYNANVSAAPVPMQQQQQQQQQPQQQAATVLHHQQQQAPLPQPPQTQILPLQQPMQQVLASGLPPTVNGSVHPDELNVIQGGPPAVVSAAPPQLVSGAQILPAPAVVSAPPIAAANLVQPQPINNQQPPGVVQTSVAMAAAQSIEETANHQVVTESGAVAPPVPMVMEESSNESRETINNYNNNSVMEQQQPIDAEPKEQHHHHQYRHDSQHVLSVVGDAPEPVRPAVTTPPTVAAPPAPVASAVSVEPKSWANLLKSGNSGGGSSSTYNSGSVPSQSFGSTAVQSMVGSGAPTQMPATIIPRTGSPPMGPRGDQSGMNSRNSLGRNPRPQQQQRPLNKDIGRGGPGRNSLNDDDDRKRSQSNSFTDVNQLFLGNLPHNATEDELREIFSEFGTILDLRIHSKPASKMAPAGMRAPPNFGFITYEAHIGVQACLAAKPIFYPRGDTSGTQLNVEEKRTNKDRQSFGGNGSGGGGGRLGNNNFNNDNRPPRENNGNNGSSGGIPNRRGGSMGPGSNARNSNSLGGGNTAGGGLGGGSGTTVGAPSNRTNNGYSGSNNRGGSGPPPNRGGGPNTYNSRR